MLNENCIFVVLLADFEAQTQKRRFLREHDCTLCCYVVLTSLIIDFYQRIFFVKIHRNPSTPLQSLLVLLM